MGMLGIENTIYVYIFIDKSKDLKYMMTGQTQELLITDNASFI